MEMSSNAYPFDLLDEADSLDRSGVEQSLNINRKLPEIIWAIDRFDGQR
jgi:hypothetical protein